MMNTCIIFAFVLSVYTCHAQIAPVEPVPVFRTVDELFQPFGKPDPHLSTDPGFDPSIVPEFQPGLGIGLQRAAGSAQLGVVANVSPQLQAITKQTGSCTSWCRTNQGQVYCCENDIVSPNLPIIKTGRCPPRAPGCGAEVGAVEQCFSDRHCSGSAKCCYDPCRNHRICSEPVPL
ncbi:hypothetical protein SK128_004323 [Halocaridina rubra]|uniref:WAP domain-containing protein n=1 Tax=Halocaridina rubra TaxID=373956 RepID=A0AAN8WRH3_HALRR